MIIAPSILHGTITAPPSKSAGVRAAMAMMLAGVQPRGLGESGDVQAATAAARAWLAGESTLNVGESALAARIMACAAALRPAAATIAGAGTLLRRPMMALADALRQLGVQVEGVPLRQLGVQVEGAALPMRITGPMRGGAVTVDGAAGSQVVTGLLMTLPLVPQDSLLRVVNPTSIPYIYMTLDLLAQCGVRVEREGWDFRIGGGQRYVLPPDLPIEGDWSGASCLLAVGDITVAGLAEQSRQADRAVVDALRAAGAAVSFGSAGVEVRRGAMKAFEFDAANCPDLFPALVALAASCEGVTTLRGAKRLADKESPRGQVLQQEYGKMGIFIDLDGDVMRVHGGRPRGGATVDSHGDHRIAMSLAVVAARALEPVTLLGADAVNKSYPNFWRDYEILSAAASS